MVILEMIDLLIESNEYVIKYSGEELTGFFGDGQLIGVDDLPNKPFAAIYSDTVADGHSPFGNAEPEYIYLLDDGRCVFLYMIDLGHDLGY